MLATSRRQTVVVQLLLSKGANIEVSNKVRIDSQLLGENIRSVLYIIFKPKYFDHYIYLENIWKGLYIYCK